MQNVSVGYWNIVSAVIFSFPACKKKAIRFLTKLLLQYLIVLGTSCSCSKQASLPLRYKPDDCLLTWTENRGPWRDGNARFEKQHLSALIVFAGIDTRTQASPAVAVINFSVTQICSVFHRCRVVAGFYRVVSTVWQTFYCDCAGDLSQCLQENK